MDKKTPHAEKFSLYDAFLEPYESNASIVDLLPIDMLPLIHEHWYSFPPMKGIWHIILGLAIILLGIVSLSGNGVVLYLMASVRSLRTPANLLVMNLALSDFCMLAFMMPTMAPNCFGETWVLGPLMCEVYGMFGSLFGCGSVWSMVMITLDRYNVIVKGMSAKPLTRLKSVGLVIFVWVWSVGWTIAPFYGWSRYVPEGSMTGCTVDYLSRDLISLSYLISYTIAVYVIPLGVMIYCYTFIVVEVAAHEKKLREQAKKMNISSLRANQDSHKASAEFKLAKPSASLGAGETHREFKSRFFQRHIVRNNRGCYMLTGNESLLSYERYENQENETPSQSPFLSSCDIHSLFDY
ncbi:ocellar opsin [Nephila pilipes]|uniref:Ocellar opsin n=1 Tax=Nephila pilipes TaxID=299642 RepID=A0A8X6PHL8_NEPPI|nr:ocellar opsin [Nephila pilipes]